jgi:uncharacterized protein YunC (DUF1805 family)
MSGAVRCLGPAGVLGFPVQRSGITPKPLLLIIAPKGFLACGYIDVESCNKTKEACAIVTGVSNQDDMKKASIKKVSESASKLGIKVGMTGAEALTLLK